MKLPIDNEADCKENSCFVCKRQISGVPIILSVDTLQWEPGRVSEQMAKDPEFFPSPARMPRIVTGESRLRLLDGGGRQTGNRYLAVISLCRAAVSFCSTACLRRFFNLVVDEFEKSAQ